MLRCPSCSRESSDAARFCPWCAAPLTGLAVSSAETAVMGAAAASHPSLTSSSSVDEGRFLPGTMLAGRYRIAGLLGRGGMGEVYRATDLTLGQAVALKFLPEDLSRDERALVRFYNEVRMARQVTHPNVCRVYDIGQVDGLHYISMEYVDGEDLSHLLRRIGRLPIDKAVETARQLCAGLAAAHEKGVLHRDLKPANVMIDGRGNVIIMDFGLAGLSDQLHGDVRSGTPAYMSPEQLAGTEVTAKSDIYALGLVLYELFTGRRAFDAATLMELVQQQERSAPASITSVVKDLDPVVERVILRCLSRNPADRPPSAHAVAAALPGGDPLAAALAAGETPSPDLVAAAGENEGLRPRIALVWLVAALAGVALVGVWAANMSVTSKIRLDAPPEALARDARAMLSSFGYTARPAAVYRGMAYSTSVQNYLGAHPAYAQTYWQNNGAPLPPIIQFWYRETAVPVVGVISFNTLVTNGDPPLDRSGMIRIYTGPDGELQHLEVVPPQISPPAPAAPFDWNLLFRAARLDPSRFQPADPQWLPLASWDARAAWTGTDPRTPLPLRVEAAAWHGRPVFFRVIGPWTTPERDSPQFSKQSPSRLYLPWIVLILAIPIAWTNILAGRADLHGGAKLALICFGSMFLGRLIVSPHSLAEAEVSVLWRCFGVAASNAVPVFLCYVSLEPWVRKKWPQTMISWSRFTTKGLRDPVVARDLLIGVVYGWLNTALNLVALHATHEAAWMAGLDPIQGVRPFLDLLGGIIASALYQPIQYFFVFFVCKVLLRKDWAATAAFVAVLTFWIVGTGSRWQIVVIGAGFAILYASALRNYGLLALVAGNICARLLMSIPRTLDFSVWYAALGAAPVVVVAILAIYAFRLALGKQRLFENDLFSR